jgi:hypothetical protein
MVFRTEDKTKIIAKRNGKVVGSISYLDLEKNFISRAVFPIESYIKAPIEISVVEEENETHIGIFELEETHGIMTNEGFIIINGARLKQNS